MRRRVLGILGTTLVMLFPAASAGRAQDIQPPIPKLADLSTLPKLDLPVPAEPLLVGAAPNFDVKISPNTGMPKIDGAADKQVFPLAALAIQSSEYIDPRYVANSQYPDEMGIWEHARVGYHDQFHRLINDFKVFYLTDNMLYLCAAIAAAAPLANTHADIGIRDWYQRGAGNGRSRAADETAKVFKDFGDYRYTVPILVALSFTEHLCPDSPAAGVVSDFSNRSLRAMAVGAPAVGILQVGLGSTRPFTQDSRWHPFRSNKAVSGHGFIGAVPFLTAASMTESRALKFLLVAASLGPTWSRLHDDDHYFSQCLLGWSIAYLSVQSVNQTESRFRLVPVELPNGIGMGVELQF